MTVVVDHGVTETGATTISSGPRPARKRRLGDIFGGGSRFDASFEEREKLPVSANQ